MRIKRKILLVWLFLFSAPLFAYSGFFPKQNDISLQIPYAITKGVPTTLEISIINDSLSEKHGNETALIHINNNVIPVQFVHGKASVVHSFFDAEEVSFCIGGFSETRFIKPVPQWMSILPPLLAILLALLFKEVIVSLFIGLFAGSLIVSVYAEGFLGIATGFFRLIDTYIIGALNSSDHLSIIVFSMLIGSMVAIISSNGGMGALVKRISKFAKTPKSGQFSTWLMGMAIFFDDYSNTLVVGNTMRPITDKLRISREKLAYIVDSTAAPIVSIAFITTWIGAELGYISDAIQGLELNETPYAVFLHSLKYSFYPIFTLLFVLIIIRTGRDFGPMLPAEKKARSANPVVILEKQDEIKIKSGIWNALIPVFIVIFGTIAALLYTGWTEEVAADNSGFWVKLSVIIGNGDPYRALLWASMASVITAIVMTRIQGIMGVKDLISTTVAGLKTMLDPIIILVLAWGLAGITSDMHTAHFITESFISGNLPYWLLPFITFILAALIAFSTGSSWGTMAILYPLMLPATWMLCQRAGLEYDQSLAIFHNVVSCVLAGSVLGDHCSPISDTTIMSSLASSCDHIAHVRTQLPYAMLTGVIALFAGTLLTTLGFPVILSYLLGIILMFAAVRIWGKPSAV